VERKKDGEARGERGGHGGERLGGKMGGEGIKGRRERREKEGTSEGNGALQNGKSNGDVKNTLFGCNVIVHPMEMNDLDITKKRKGDQSIP